jgi:ankyrin repeat protein
MSSFLIEKFEKNINLTIDIVDQNLLNHICISILSKNEKESVLFLIQNDKIHTSLSLNLFEFIVNNKFFDLFLQLDFNKYNIHINDDYALRMASRNGHIEAVKFLVKKGSKIHTQDDYALRWSSHNGHIEVIKFLVENDANIHAQDDCSLRWASKYGYLEVVKFLIENGANIHADDDCALNWSIKFGYIDVVKFLIENGADIRKINDNTLIFSSQYKNIDVIKFLIQSDIEYFKNNKLIIQIVLKHKLTEFYQIFDINTDISLIKNDIFNQIKNIECVDFSSDDYFYFFNVLVTNNIELLQIIFDKIKNKDDLLNLYNKISFLFDENTKNKFIILYKNEKLKEIKRLFNELNFKLNELNNFSL